MTARRRASGQRDRQRLGLAALAKARHSYPTQGTGDLDPRSVPLLATLASIEAALSIARLGRLSADPDDDKPWRMVIVIGGALARAISDGLIAGDDQALERLYLAVSNFQRHKESTL